MADIVTKQNIDLFKMEMGWFNNLNGKLPITPMNNDFSFSDYLRWCEVQKLDKIIQLLEIKSQL